MKLTSRARKWLGIKFRYRLHNPVQVAYLLQCGECGSSNSGSYMVKGSVWKAAGLKSKGVVLCLPCLIKRLGRMLTRKDFIHAPINDWIFGGSRVDREKKVVSCTGLHGRKGVYRALKDVR